MADTTIRAFGDALATNPSQWENSPLLNDTDRQDLANLQTLGPTGRVEQSRTLAERILDRNRENPRIQQANSILDHTPWNQADHDAWNQATEQK